MSSSSSGATGMCCLVACRWVGRGRDPRYAVVDLTRDWIAHCTVGDFPAFQSARFYDQSSTLTVDERIFQLDICLTGSS